MTIYRVGIASEPNRIDFYVEAGFAVDAAQAVFRVLAMEPQPLRPETYIPVLVVTDLEGPPVEQSSSISNQRPGLV